MKTPSAFARDGRKRPACYSISARPSRLRRLAFGWLGHQPHPSRRYAPKGEAGLCVLKLGRSPKRKRAAV